jgi:hypothetical protein
MISDIRGQLDQSAVQAVDTSAVRSGPYCVCFCRCGCGPLMSYAGMDMLTDLLWELRNGYLP